ncbi:bifunctional acetate--CoA ligase family protein/GNAT family N-acetyltransferase [Ornithinimicrobium cryptoxanthini]|uniref:GNAT family N-acetyltransferase n=1 Tax=Ornithinimicrobium cryptoxanthini TaxID=2934161 RepID=A0ABY4YM26_9MICO|nr:bifunctional GNAT family N-acetyltransferase/acetate--CoA ligase family protein [Ornithinimicrobium cryptoxanthini]USQ77616.1 GNAT family N-acetyltransferase [Ornithinimicrobium cryptoxanthini]
MIDVPPGYPREWEADVVLSDGSVAHVRPIVPGDVEGLHEFHSGQSEESIYLRFFAPLRRLSDKDATRFATVDYDKRVALVMLIGDEIAGIGRYDRIEETGWSSAEVAFNVADKHQGRGIGSVLLEHLAAIGRESGVALFVADVLPQNRKMINVFQDAGYEVSHEFEDGVIVVSFAIEPTEASRAVELSREHRSEARSMRRVLHPSSVVVVGASRRPGSVGGGLVRHMREGGFAGDLYVVNHAAEEVAGLKTWSSVSQIGSPIDLALIAVPAAEVPSVVRECAFAGVGAVVVVSAGFAEAGEEGVELQRQLLATARTHGLRVLGPNSFGLINTTEGVSLNASLSPQMPMIGSLGLFAQSGALAIAVLASAERRGLGISSFASAGNRVDISGNDLMQYWIEDEATAVVGLYLESMGNPRKFTRISRQLSAVKPVIVVKSGTGQHAVPGHTVRATRERPEAFAEMLKQSGVIRVENTHQMFDVAQLVVHQPLPRGRAIAIVTNSDALGMLTADAAESWDLTITHGPVALPSTATVAEFNEALEAALTDPAVDSLVACFIPPIVTSDTEVVAQVEQTVAAHDKPCVATFLGMRGVAPGGSLPAYPMPEDAVRALAAATDYAAWRGRERGERVRPGGVNRRLAHDVVESALAGGGEGREMTDAEVTDLLSAYGIEVVPSQLVHTAQEAVDAAAQLGRPVVLKATSPDLRHGTGHYWIRTDLQSPETVADAFAGLSAVLRQRGDDGIVLQEMAPAGVVVEITSAEDPLFGPVVGFGVAGVPSDLLGDVTHRFPPLTSTDVADMVSGVRAAPLLDGYRGTDPVDQVALHDLLARVSVLADDLPEVQLLRLNPVVAHQGGIMVLGATARIARDEGRADAGRRSLTR